MPLKPFAHEFMVNTRYASLSPSAQSQHLPQPPLELPLPEGAVPIPLPAPAELDDIPTIDLRTAIERRRTRRQYSEAPLSLHELSFLLWCTQGVQQRPDPRFTLRTVPSAGARHAFETFLLINRVEGLQPGIYQFSALQHALAAFDLSEGRSEALTAACGGQNQVRTSAVTFIWTAVVERMAWRYVERGYRYLHLDAGHVCQNLYLAAEAVACGVCAIAAYNDEAVNDLLHLDGESQFAIYLASLGKTA